MRRGVPIVIAVLALLAPASTSAATNNAKLFFTDLAEQRLKPAPLVPTTAPRSLSPVGESIATFDQPHGYYIRLADTQRGHPHALVELLASQYPSARAAVHAYRGGGFRPRSTVVRGKRGFLLTHKRDRALVWTEGGVVYVLLTTTGKTVSLSELRATATGLERLEGVWDGNDERADNEVIVAATTHTVTVEVRFTGQCVTPSTGEPSALRRATAQVAFLRRQGNGFSFDIAPNVEPDRSGLTWQGTVSGTVGSSGGTVNLRATAADSQEICDTGPVSLTLGRFPNG